MQSQINFQTRRRMRKGTRSCTECRRRKRLCKYIAESGPCVLCSARGSLCIQQGAGDEADAIATVTAEQGTTAYSQRLRQNQFNIPPGVCSPGEARNGTTDQSDLITDIDQDSGDKSASICRTLHAALPRFATLISTLSNNGTWWYQYCQRTYPVGYVPAESLIEFARYNNEDLYSLVDRLVLSDSTYLNTLEGGECIVYLAEAYSAIGQLKKAWQLWRKGVSLIQLMAPHTANHPNSMAAYRVCSIMYHSDRFWSLFLGLPYGFVDAHYYHTTGISPDDDSMLPEHRFALQCSVIAGRVIDRNLDPTKSLSAKAMELDEHMNSIASSMPKDWWHLPTQLPRSGPEEDQLRATLTQQFYFFLIKTYIHLPFLLNSEKDTRSSSCGFICMDSARQTLRRCLLSIDGGEIYFNFGVINDFLCLNMAIILLLGHSCAQSAAGAKYFETDMHLVASVEQMLHDRMEVNGGKVTAQCCKMLKTLSSTASNNDDDFEEATREILGIVKPYFDMVVQQRNEKQWPTMQLNTTDKIRMVRAQETDDVHPSTLIRDYPTLSSGSVSESRSSEYNQTEMDYGYQENDVLESNGALAALETELHNSNTDIEQDWGVYSLVNWDMFFDRLA